MKTISVPTELAAAILRTKTALPANLYLIARFYDKTGSGKAKLSDCKNLLRVAGRSFNIVDSVLRSKGFNTYFNGYDKKTGMLYYRSLGEVAVILGVAGRSNASVEMDIITASKSKKDFKAQMYAATLAGINGPISRAALSEITNSSDTAQKEWETKAGIDVQSHFIEGTPEQLRNMLKKDAKGNYLFCTSSASEKGRILIQTSNTYHTKLYVRHGSYLVKRMKRCIAANPSGKYWGRSTVSEQRSQKFFYTEDEINARKSPVKKMYIERPYVSIDRSSTEYESTFYAVNGDQSIDLELRKEMGLIDPPTFILESISTSW